jgi:hypothetical protein
VQVVPARPHRAEEPKMSLLKIGLLVLTMIVVGYGNLLSA